eukprot:gnl/TRDRNA2_/TRDRNA2_35340_c0_seq1.p1 gnl/TRDRNA2_/TRDRNA2_35340_c0~~gnl/TRDRNA2_/TRDRNA2_35340_c0_seq1.p1  ORF type:complete len:782 (-),score=123.76 gnl/TRDRNA2_/TRDRNA2_35340_c0_seq1:139-2484(-)
MVMPSARLAVGASDGVPAKRRSGQAPASNNPDGKASGGKGVRRRNGRTTSYYPGDGVTVPPAYDAVREKAECAGFSDGASFVASVLAAAQSGEVAAGFDTYGARRPASGNRWASPRPCRGEEELWVPTLGPAAIGMRDKPVDLAAGGAYLAAVAAQVGNPGVAVSIRQALDRMQSPAWSHNDVGDLDETSSSPKAAPARWRERHPAAAPAAEGVAEVAVRKFEPRERQMETKVSRVWRAPSTKQKGQDTILSDYLDGSYGCCEQDGAEPWVELANETAEGLRSKKWQKRREMRQQQRQQGEEYSAMATSWLPQEAAALPPVQDLPQQTVDCPQGHALKPFFTPNDGFFCDYCSMSQSKGSPMLGCRQCEYDLCACCVEADWQSKTNAAVQQWRSVVPAAKSQGRKLQDLEECSVEAKLLPTDRQARWVAKSKPSTEAELDDSVASSANAGSPDRVPKKAKRKTKGKVLTRDAPPSTAIARSSDADDLATRPATSEPSDAKADAAAPVSWADRLKGSAKVQEPVIRKLTADAASKALAGQRSLGTLTPGSHRAPSARTAAMLVHRSMPVQAGKMCNLMKDTCLTEEMLWDIFYSTMHNAGFKWFAGRSIMDFKVKGEKALCLSPPFDTLNPMVSAMVALADRTMRPGEELAVIQLIVNLFKDGGDEVKPHMHRCRQICCALGATRDLVVEGRTHSMGFGDALPLWEETHSVPPLKNVGKPRISVCLFYGSKDEYANKSISVNAVDGWFGSSYWWTHPKELEAMGLGSKGRGKGRGRGRGTHQ